MRRLLDSVRTPVHRTCLATMYACGLRVGEAITLEITAVDRVRRVLRIIGKGDKERLVPLPQAILDDLGHLWRTHRNRRWLFPIVQVLLGHARIATTAIYTHLTTPTLASLQGLLDRLMTGL